MDGNTSPKRKRGYCGQKRREASAIMNRIKSESRASEEPITVENRLPSLALRASVPGGDKQRLPTRQKRKQPPELYQVVIECRDEQQQRELYERMKGEGMKVRLMVL
jgi:hypothetical protein